jgi:hypothetical protein
MNIIALDPGFGNTKICLDNNTFTMPSAVAHPREIGLAGIGMKSVEKSERIIVDDQEFAIGDGAWNQGSSANGMDYVGLASAPRKALFFGCMSHLMAPGNYEFDALIIGLPVPLLMDSSQAQSVFERLKTLKGTHSFAIKKKNFQIEIKKIKILAQPAGAFADWWLDETCTPKKRLSQSEIGVLDIGMNTLDLYAFQNGKVTPKFVGGSKLGVRRLLEMINDNHHEMHELDNLLRRRQLRPSKSQTSQWLDEIFHSVENTWTDFSRFTSIIPVGGGAQLLGDQLRSALLAKGAKVDWPENPITANVSGLWKWGSYEFSKKG